MVATASIIKLRHTVTENLTHLHYTCFSIYVATFPISLGNIETCVWVLQTASGEGVEKVEGPSPRGEGGEGERGPQTRTQEDKVSQWLSDY